MATHIHTKNQAVNPVRKIQPKEVQNDYLECSTQEQFMMSKQANLSANKMIKEIRDKPMSSFK